MHLSEGGVFCETLNTIGRKKTPTSQIVRVEVEKYNNKETPVFWDFPRARFPAALKGLLAGHGLL